MWLPPACLNPEQYARLALYLESALIQRAFCSWQAGEIVSLIDATKTAISRAVVAGTGRSSGRRVAAAARLHHGGAIVAGGLMALGLGGLSISARPVCHPQCRAARRRKEVGKACYAPPRPTFRKRDGWRGLPRQWSRMLAAESGRLARMPKPTEDRMPSGTKAATEAQHIARPPEGQRARPLRPIAPPHKEK